MGDGPLGVVQVAADLVKDPCPENTTTTNSKLLVNGQSQQIERCVLCEKSLSREKQGIKRWTY